MRPRHMAPAAEDAEMLSLGFVLDVHDCVVQSRPWRTAQIAAWIRFGTLSFLRMLDTWFFAVRGLISSFAAISTFSSPRAMSLSTSSSRGVRSSPGVRPSPASVLVTAHTAEHRLGRTRGEPCRALSRRANRAGDVVHRRVLDQKATGAGGHYGRDVTVLGRHGQAPPPSSRGRARRSPGLPRRHRDRASEGPSTPRRA